MEADEERTAARVLETPWLKAPHAGGSPPRELMDGNSSRRHITAMRGAAAFQQHCRLLMAEYENLQGHCRNLSKENARLTAQVRRMFWSEGTTNRTDVKNGAAAGDDSVEADAMATAMEAAAAMFAVQADGSMEWEELSVPRKTAEHSEVCTSPRPVAPDGDADFVGDAEVTSVLRRPATAARKDGALRVSVEDPSEVLLDDVIPIIPQVNIPAKQSPAQVAAMRAVTAEMWNEEARGDTSAQVRAYPSELPHHDGDHGTASATFRAAHSQSSHGGRGSKRATTATRASKNSSRTSKSEMEASRSGSPKDSDGEAVTRKATRASVNIKELEAQVLNQRTSLGCRAERLENLLKGRQLDGARSMCNSILKHWVFDSFIGVVIIANSCTIGIESSLVAAGQAELPTYLVVLEPVFLTIYVLELGARLFVYGPRVLRDPWVFFDLILVVCGVIGVFTTYVLSAPDSVLQDIMLIRTMRLARLARAVRLLVQFRTLWLLVQGLIHSCTTLCWTFVIMFALIYVFAIVGLEVVADDPTETWEYREKYRQHFSGLGYAMLTLLQVLTLDSVGQIYTPLIVAKPELAVYFVAFILLASVALTNLVTAIMVESSMAQANNDKEGRAEWLNARKKAMIPKLKAIFEEMDKDGSGELALSEVMDAPAWVKEHLTLVANLSDVEEIFHMVDYDGSGAVTIEEFVEGITKANEASKPMELMRIMKQCSDILRFARLMWYFLDGLAWAQGLDTDELIRRTGNEAANEFLYDMRQRDHNRADATAATASMSEPPAVVKSSAL